MHLFANRRFLTIALIFLLLTWAMFVTSRERAHESKVEYFFNTAVAPLESILTHLSRLTDDSWKTISELSRLKSDNEQLRRQVALFQARQMGLDDLRAENQRLREALGFQNIQSHDMVAAEIIAVNPSNWNRTLTINKGENAGLRRNMAVITPQGVVGRIMEVRSKTAEIILLSDSREDNSIGGVIARTQSMVIVAGGGDYLGQCTVRPAVDSFFSDIKENDLIVTAATSDFFPRGIPIGRIAKVNYGHNQMVDKAILEPEVKLNRMQTVYVIKIKHDLPISSDSSPSGGA